MTTESDDELLSRARAGDSAAYGELWRRHSGVGTAVARRVAPPDLADDLVAEAFVRILSTIQRGNGPISGFRPYLITTIRNVARRWAEKPQAVHVDDFDQFEDPDTIDDPAIAALDRTLTLTAFRSLPERWQTVLWYSEVEGMDPHEIAPFLGMTPNATAALSYRARAGLREAWLQVHLKDDSSSPDCRWTTARLSGYVADKLSMRDRERVADHLTTCTKCTIIAGELDHIGARLAFVLIPLLLGSGVSASILTFGAHGSLAAPATAAPPMPQAQLASFSSSPAPSGATVGAPGWVMAGVVVLVLAGAGVAAIAVNLNQASTVGSVAAPTESTPDPSTSAPSDHPEPTPSSTPQPPPPPPPANVVPPASPPIVSTPAITQATAVTIVSPASGLVTSNNSPTITGTGTAGDTVVISENNAPDVTTLVDGAGHWSAVLSLLDGSHALAITQTVAGSLPSPAVALSIEVDTVAPVAPIVTTAVDDAVLQPITLAGTAEPGAAVTIYDNLGTLLESTTAGPSGSWASSPLTALLPTATSLQVFQTDAAGNVSPAATFGPLALVPTILAPASGDQFMLGDPVPVDLLGWPGTDLQLWLDGNLMGLPGQPSVTLDANGTASLTFIGLLPGPHSLAVSYFANSQASPAQALTNFVVLP